MSANTYTPATTDPLSVCFAFLSYIGESRPQTEGTTQKILSDILTVIATTPTLCLNGQPDWEIVWGPSIYTYPEAKAQDSGMFVARQISAPNNYYVAIRGTNATATLDWIFEDFDVLGMKDWPGAPSAKISNATHNGVHLLLDKLVPDSGLPGEKQCITTFLTGLTQTPVNICFTGHSLGGALAPTTALHFKDSQGVVGGFDPDSNATISCTAFAGATAGNAEFAAYSNRQFAKAPIRRIHNTNDVVPHAWEKSTLEQMPNLYDSISIKLDEKYKILLDLIIVATENKHYTQIETSVPITFPLDASQGDQYFSQAGYQHDHSYPLIVLGNEQGQAFLTLVDSYK
ncbi:lipase family protein [Teredinibacter purpureus]|uniref:lipase family protein n=1 Tax=Teredinibacter purpureus TaxID=2731756 RepID=UPI0005F852CE|nr:hypothetical protein [Teredinibacter purpureus]